MFPKKKVLLFVAIFYGCLFLYLLCGFLFPTCALAQLTNIFESMWANFVLVAISLLFIAFVLSELTFFVYRRLRTTRWFRPKLGEILVSEGYLSDEKLREALSEQGLRIGEVLMKGGRVTREQLDEALAQQKMDPKSTGEILIELGYATEDDIIWALNKMERRLGRILRDKGYLTDHEVRRILFRQRRGPE